MYLTFEKGGLGTASHGLEIGVFGFRDNPTTALEFPSQIFIEVYEEKLRVHVWDGTSEDPQTIIIDPLQCQL